MSLPSAPRRVPPRALRAAATLASAALGAACGGGDEPTEPPAPNVARDTVFMPGNTFSPFVVVVRPGESVAWAFPRDAHNVIFPKLPGGQPRVPGSPADILPTTDRVVVRRFDAAGTFAYDCTLHDGMRGEVVVE